MISQGALSRRPPGRRFGLAFGRHGRSIKSIDLAKVEARLFDHDINASPIFPPGVPIIPPLRTLQRVTVQIRPYCNAQAWPVTDTNLTASVDW